METHNLLQNSPEWHAYRAQKFNASDAPAMLGVSKYKTREQLLHERATGIAPEVNAAVQKRFDDGHRFEALARPIAEKIIGAELYPVTGSLGNYSASFDGITMDENIIFEHKTLNDELRLVDLSSYAMPEMYRVQMEQQLMVSGAESCLFMASKWEGDELIEARDAYYFPDFKLRQRIVDGWAQFEKDLANYVMPEVIEKVIGADVQSLPVPSVQVKGELVACNLELLTPMFDKFLTETNTKLTTDQDFADADINAKKAREAASNLKLTAKAIVNQMASVSAVVGALENYAKAFDTLGLNLEKAVKEQKELIKSNAILKARQEYFLHVDALGVEIAPIHLISLIPDFATAIKGLKTLESLHSKIRTTYTQGIIDADAAARDIRAKLTWFNEVAVDFKPLFADLQTIIYKPMDDFKIVIDTRIANQLKIEAERAERVRLEAEKQAEIKANAEAQAKIAAEQRAALEAERAAAIPTRIEKAEQVAQKAETAISQPVSSDSKAQPSAESLVMAIASAFRVSNNLAHTWLAETDFSSKALEAA